MDSTHGTNSYDLYLTTVLVLDDYGEGVPLAWLLSNREDTLILVEFMKNIKARIGNVSLLWFMTDMAEQYWTSCSI